MNKCTTVCRMRIMVKSNAGGVDRRSPFTSCSNIYQNMNADPVRTIMVPRCLTEGQFKTFIEEEYPQLKNKSFDLCKVNRHHVVIPLNEETPKAIRSSGVLGRSALYLQPSFINEGDDSPKAHHNDAQDYGDGVEEVVNNESGKTSLGHHDLDDAHTEMEGAEERRRLIKEQDSEYEQSLLLVQEKQLILYAGAVQTATESLTLISHNPAVHITTSCNEKIGDYITQPTTFFVRWIEAEDLSGVPDPPVNIAEVYDTEMQNQLDKEVYKVYVMPDGDISSWIISQTTWQINLLEISRAVGCPVFFITHNACIYNFSRFGKTTMGDGDAAVEVDGGDRLSVTLQDVLVFASGASAIPVFGFKENPNITFLHENIDGNRLVFPEANTCSMTVKLPIGQEYDEFCRLMTAALVQSPTFGVSLTLQRHYSTWITNMARRILIQCKITFNDCCRLLLSSLNTDLDIVEATIVTDTLVLAGHVTRHSGTGGSRDPTLLPLAGHVTRHFTAKQT
ncbi:hypothetical protein E1301_Tti022788 [Triplophysa tibetana]|uniref:HECT domain-containing protein n=1 Tax=Triplophysa tibetana TaxID=1572043 RepID=A0A5A9PGP0_9TELE|nr:hypothetical protein E1301_Tti022788 [Triplophysa tibetana]